MQFNCQFLLSTYHALEPPGRHIPYWACKSERSGAPVNRAAPRLMQPPDCQPDPISFLKPVNRAFMPFLDTNARPILLFYSKKQVCLLLITPAKTITIYFNCIFYFYINLARNLLEMFRDTVNVLCWRH